MATLIPAIGTCVPRMNPGKGWRPCALSAHRLGSGMMSLPQLARMRNNRFAQVQVQSQSALFDDKDDGIPLFKPVSCGREGQAPVIIELPTLRDEAVVIAAHLASAHQEGFAWGDMAVPCAGWKTIDLCARALSQRKLPHRVRKKSGKYRPGADAIQVITMKVSKGLDFPVVALPGVGNMPAAVEDEKDAARVFYVAATSRLLKY